MSDCSEVNLIGSRSAFAQKCVLSVSMAATVAGGSVAVGNDPRWWVILVWAVVTLFVAAIAVGHWATVTADLRSTRMLVDTGVVTRADVIESVTESGDDSVTYVLTLRIRPIDGDAFTVTHRCARESCKAAALAVPTTIAVLVDRRTRAWAALDDATAYRPRDRAR